MIFKYSNASLHGSSNDMISGGQNGGKLHSKTEHTAAIYGNFCPLEIFVARVIFYHFSSLNCDATSKVIKSANQKSPC